MNFIKRFRFGFLGFVIGATVQLPMLIMLKAWFAVGLQATVLAICLPLMLIGFLKK